METMLLLALGIYAALTLSSMALMSVGAAIALLGIFAFFKSPRGFARALRAELSLPGGRLYGIAALGLALACVLSLVTARVFPLAYDGQVSEVHVLRDSLKLWYLFWPLPLAAGLRALGSRRRDAILKSWLVVFTVVSVIGILQFWTGWPRPRGIPGGAGHFHATLFLGHHLSVASVLIFPFFVSVDFARRSIVSRRTVLGFGAPIWVLICVLGAAALLFTYSRTLWVALPIGITVWVLLTLPKKWAFSIVAALIVLSVGLLQLPLVKDRLGLGVGLPDREQLWIANFSMFQARPITGVGWLHNQELSGYYLMEKLHTNDVFSGHAHNNILDMLSGTGLLGLSFWIFWSAVAFILAWRARRAWGPGLFCAWVVFQVNGLTQVNFWDAKVTHQMMWVVAWLLV